MIGREVRGEEGSQCFCWTGAGGDSGRWEVKCLLSRVVHNTMNRAY